MHPGHIFRLACQESVAKPAEGRRGLPADCLEQPGEAQLDFDLPADLHARLQSHGEPI